jgi:hypothetical protein
MEPTTLDSDVPEIQHWGRTLLYAALAQTDVDMAHHQLLNLDTSNLIGLGAPPTIHPPANQWLHDWDTAAHAWTTTQPNFSHLAGNLTQAQQRAITQLGTVTVGVWQASIINPAFLPNLNAIRAPVTDVSMAGHKLTGLADPTNAQDAVNLRFLDSMVEGLNPKAAVRLATAAPTNLFGLPIVDGIQTAPNNRILVKNRQTEPHKIGIYVIGTDTNHTWTRSPDCNHTDPAHPETDLNRAYCTVLEGNLNAGTAWVQVNHCVNPDPDYILEAKNFVLFSSASAIGPPGPPGAGVPQGGAINQVLAKAGPEDYNTHWVDPTGGVGGQPPVYQYLQTVPTGNITGITDTAGRMAGLAGYIQPSANGKLVATIAGYIWNSNAAGQATVRMAIGTGTAPDRGAVKPPSNTYLAVGAIILAFEGGTSKAVPFSVSDVIQLTPGIRYWYDLILAPVTTGDCNVGGVAISVCEIP